MMCVVFLGLVYQEGNQMNQYKLQNKRATGLTGKPTRSLELC